MPPDEQDHATAAGPGDQTVTHDPAVLLAAVVESSEDAIVTATPDGRITTWNPAARRMFGWTAEEIVGRMITELLAPELGAQLMEMFGRVLAGQRLTNVDTPAVHKDGTVTWVSVTAFPVTDAAGRVLGGTSILRDITERRRLDRTLRRQTAAIELLGRVAVAANNASTLEEAATGALAAVCTSGRWLAGHLYPVRPDGTAASEGIRHVADASAESLIAGKTRHPELVATAIAERRPVAGEGVAVVPIMVGAELAAVAELVGTARSHTDAASLEVLGQVAGLLGRLAERVRAEEALRASEERSRAILQTAGDAFVGMDAQGRITEWNQRAEALSGWSLSEVAGQSFSETLFPERFRKYLDLELRQLAEARGDASADADVREHPDVAVLHRDGHEIPATLSLWPVHTRAGLNLNAFLRDVSQANDLLELQAQFVAIVQSSDDAIVGMTTHCVITSWNPGAEALYGYRAVEVLGRTIDFLTPEEASGRVPIVRRAALGERIRNRRTVARRKDGTTVAISLSAAPILDGAGNVTGISSIGRDITDRKLAEQAIEEANARLSSTVEQLRRRNDEITQMNEMGDLLQSCRSMEEAREVIAASLARLFPGDDGALCLIAASRNVLEAGAVWGAGPIGEPLFAPEACWALRRGRVHVSRGPGTGPLCQHAGVPPPPAYVCVPMMAQGETLGLLHVRCGAGIADIGEWLASAGRLASAVAEHLSLSLGNFRLRETLRNQSIRDPLTGLYNRRYAEETLERELHRSVRSGKPIGLISIDLDHFKRFNDRYGHETGDAVLRRLSEFLASSVRDGDIACRFGGEEFLLILPEAPLEATAARAAAIRDGARGIRLPPPAPAGEGLTVSAGVAAFPMHGTDLRDLVRAADLALYQAKDRGRDQVVVAEAAPNAATTPRTSSS